MDKPVLKPKDYKTEVHNDWCPGCGDFGILNAVHQTLAKLELDPSQVMMYSGVGCSSKIPHYVKTYGVHTLHGRSLPFSAGSKLANDDLTVIVAGGDGDGYGIGAGHFIGAGRRNTNMTYLVHNNGVYGLTKGQASPTLKLGMQTKSLPLPNPNDAINPLALAISAGYTFVARSYAYDAKHLSETIIKAVQHQGMSIVDILQPCPTYNNLHTKDWYGEEIEVQGVKMPRTYYLEEIGYDGKVSDPNNEAMVDEFKVKALTKVTLPEERIPLGVFFQVERGTYMDRCRQNVPALRTSTTVKIPIEDANHVPTTDLSAIYAEFRTDTY